MQQYERFWHFLREIGFTALEIICMPRSHDSFREDPNLLRKRDEIMNVITTRVTRLVNIAFPEEAKSDRQLDKRGILLDYLEQNKLWRDLQMAPTGPRDVTWNDWVHTPGLGSPSLVGSALSARGLVCLGLYVISRTESVQKFRLWVCMGWGGVGGARAAPRLTGAYAEGRISEQGQRDASEALERAAVVKERAAAGAGAGGRQQPRLVMQQPSPGATPPAGADCTCRRLR